MNTRVTPEGAALMLIKGYPFPKKLQRSEDRLRAGWKRCVSMIKHAGGFAPPRRSDNEVISDISFVHLRRQCPRMMWGPRAPVGFPLAEAAKGRPSDGGVPVGFGLARTQWRRGALTQAASPASLAPVGFGPEAMLPVREFGRQPWGQSLP